MTITSSHLKYLKIIKKILAKLIKKSSEGLHALLTSILWFFPYLLGIRVLGVYHQRIGHLLLETDSLLKEIELGKRKVRRWLVFYNPKEISNPAFIKLLPSDIIRFVPLPKSKVASILLQKPCLAYTSCSQVTAMYETASVFSINAEWGDRPPLFSCPDSWIRERQAYFQRWGIPSDAKYVCLHIREGKYSPIDEHFHQARNAEIKDYLNTVDYLASEGFYVIRMGDKSMTPSPDHPYLFDYARSEDRQDWLDLAISADCAFFLGCSSGAYNMASIFGRPVAAVNMCLPFIFSPTGRSSDIGIPKLFQRKDTKELVKFSDLFACGASEYRFAEEIDNSPYELVSNSPLEILEVVQEMVSRVRGTWIDSEEDVDLRNKVYGFLKPGSYSYGTASKCGTLFLRRYKHLLD